MSKYPLAAQSSLPSATSRPTRASHPPPRALLPASSCVSANQNPHRSEEHTSELQSLMRISYAVFCLKKKKTLDKQTTYNIKTQTITQHKYSEHRQDSKK